MQNLFATPVYEVNRTLSILLIEDSDTDADLLQESLSRTSTRMSIQRVERLVDGLRFLSKQRVDVILLDLSLPDSYSLDTFSRVHQQVPDVPIVIMTGLDDRHVAMEALRCGAQDYLLKGQISAESLFKSINYALQRKYAEQALKEAQEKVAEQSKNVSLLKQREEFMAMLTHDLKNPLIGANIVLNALAEGSFGQLSQEQTSVLHKLRDSNNDLISLIQNLIAFYKHDHCSNVYQFEDVNLTSLLEASLSASEAIAKQLEIKLFANLPSSAVVIRADINALKRVLSNLIDNALKFTKAGGAICLSLTQCIDRTIIELNDTGTGISRREIQHIFQPFWQTHIGKRCASGSGLGLYLSKQIIDAHGAIIECESEPERGTTFRIIFTHQSQVSLCN